MRNEEVKQHAVEKIYTERAPYEPPAIIYEGLITTRAVTPNAIEPNNSGTSPEDIFSSDS